MSSINSKGKSLKNKPPPKIKISKEKCEPKKQKVTNPPCKTCHTELESKQKTDNVSPEISSHYLTEPTFALVHLSPIPSTSQAAFENDNISPTLSPVYRAYSPSIQSSEYSYKDTLPADYSTRSGDSEIDKLYQEIYGDLYDSIKYETPSSSVISENVSQGIGTDSPDILEGFYDITDDSLTGLSPPGTPISPTLRGTPPGFVPFIFQPFEYASPYTPLSEMQMPEFSSPESIADSPSRTPILSRKIVVPYSIHAPLRNVFAQSVPIPLERPVQTYPSSSTAAAQTPLRKITIPVKRLYVEETLPTSSEPLTSQIPSIPPTSAIFTPSKIQTPPGFVPFTYEPFEYISPESLTPLSQIVQPEFSSPASIIDTPTRTPDFQRIIIPYKISPPSKQTGISRREVLSSYVRQRGTPVRNISGPPRRLKLDSLPRQIPTSIRPVTSIPSVRQIPSIPPTSAVFTPSKTPPGFIPFTYEPFEYISPESLTPLSQIVQPEFSSPASIIDTPTRTPDFQRIIIPYKIFPPSKQTGISRREVPSSYVKQRGTPLRNISGPPRRLKLDALSRQIPTSIRPVTSIPSVRHLIPSTSRNIPTSRGKRLIPGYSKSIPIRLTSRTIPILPATRIIPASSRTTTVIPSGSSIPIASGTGIPTLSKRKVPITLRSTIPVSSKITPTVPQKSIIPISSRIIIPPKRVIPTHLRSGIPIQPRSGFKRNAAVSTMQQSTIPVPLASAVLTSRSETPPGFVPFIYEPFEYISPEPSTPLSQITQPEFLSPVSIIETPTITPSFQKIIIPYEIFPPSRHISMSRRGVFVSPKKQIIGTPRRNVRVSPKRLRLDDTPATDSDKIQKRKKTRSIPISRTVGTSKKNICEDQSCLQGPTILSTPNIRDSQPGDTTPPETVASPPITSVKTKKASPVRPTTLPSAAVMNTSTGSMGILTSPEITSPRISTGVPISPAIVSPTNYEDVSSDFDFGKLYEDVYGNLYQSPEQSPQLQKSGNEIEQEIYSPDILQDFYDINDALPSVTGITDEEIPLSPNLDFNDEVIIDTSILPSELITPSTPQSLTPPRVSFAPEKLAPILVSPNTILEHDLSGTPGSSPIPSVSPASPFESFSPVIYPDLSQTIVSPTTSIEDTSITNYDDISSNFDLENIYKDVYGDLYESFEEQPSQLLMYDDEIENIPTPEIYSPDILKDFYDIEDILGTSDEPGPSLIETPRGTYHYPPTRIIEYSPESSIADISDTESEDDSEFEFITRAKPKYRGGPAYGLPGAEPVVQDEWENVPFQGFEDSPLYRYFLPPVPRQYRRRSDVSPTPPPFSRDPYIRRRYKPKIDDSFQNIEWQPGTTFFQDMTEPPTYVDPYPRRRELDPTHLRTTITPRIEKRRRIKERTPSLSSSMDMETVTITPSQILIHRVPTILPSIEQTSSPVSLGRQASPEYLPIIDTTPPQLLEEVQSLSASELAIPSPEVQQQSPLAIEYDQRDFDTFDPFTQEYDDSLFLTDENILPMLPNRVTKRPLSPVVPSLYTRIKKGGYRNRLFRVKERVSPSTQWPWMNLQNISPGTPIPTRTPRRQWIDPNLRTPPTFKPFEYESPGLLAETPPLNISFADYAENIPDVIQKERPLSPYKTAFIGPINRLIRKPALSPIIDFVRTPPRLHPEQYMLPNVPLSAQQVPVDLVHDKRIRYEWSPRRKRPPRSPEETPGVRRAPRIGGLRHGRAIRRINFDLANEIAAAQTPPPLETSPVKTFEISPIVPYKSRILTPKVRRVRRIPDADVSPLIQFDVSPIVPQSITSPASVSTRPDVFDFSPIENYHLSTPPEYIPIDYESPSISRISDFSTPETIEVEHDVSETGNLIQEHFNEGTLNIRPVSPVIPSVYKQIRKGGHRINLETIKEKRLPLIPIPNISPISPHISPTPPRRWISDPRTLLLPTPPTFEPFEYESPGIGAEAPPLNLSFIDYAENIPDVIQKERPLSPRKSAFIGPVNRLIKKPRLSPIIDFVRTPPRLHPEQYMLPNMPLSAQQVPVDLVLDNRIRYEWSPRRRRPPLSPEETPGVRRAPRIGGMRHSRAIRRINFDLENEIAAAQIPPPLERSPLKPFEISPIVAYKPRVLPWEQAQNIPEEQTESPTDDLTSLPTTSSSVDVVKELAKLLNTLEDHYQISTAASPLPPTPPQYVPIDYDSTSESEILTLPTAQSLPTEEISTLTPLDEVSLNIRPVSPVIPSIYKQIRKGRHRIGLETIKEKRLPLIPIPNISPISPHISLTPPRRWISDPRILLLPTPPTFEPFKYESPGIGAETPPLDLSFADYAENIPDTVKKERPLSPRKSAFIGPINRLIKKPRLSPIIDFVRTPQRLQPEEYLLPNLPSSAEQIPPNLEPDKRIRYEWSPRRKRPLRSPEATPGVRRRPRIGGMLHSRAIRRIDFGESPIKTPLPSYNDPDLINFNISPLIPRIPADPNVSPRYRSVFSPPGTYPFIRFDVSPVTPTIPADRYVPRRSRSVFSPPGLTPSPELRPKFLPYFPGTAAGAKTFYEMGIRDRPAPSLSGESPVSLPYSPTDSVLSDDPFDLSSIARNMTPPPQPFELQFEPSLSPSPLMATPPLARYFIPEFYSPPEYKTPDPFSESYHRQYLSPHTPLSATNISFASTTPPTPPRFEPFEYRTPDPFEESYLTTHTPLSNINISLAPSSPSSPDYFYNSNISDHTPLSAIDLSFPDSLQSTPQLIQSPEMAYSTPVRTAPPPPMGIRTITATPSQMAYLQSPEIQHFYDIDQSELNVRQSSLRSPMRSFLIHSPFRGQYEEILDTSPMQTELLDEELNFKWLNR